MKMRDYQEEVTEESIASWKNGSRNICMVMPTGAGKTRTFSHIIKLRDEPTVAIAHRQELVLQISESLAAFGIIHRVIAPAPVQKYCAKRHMELYGRIYVDPNAKAAVSGVQTLLRRSDSLSSYFRQVRFWVTDECHHAVLGNNPNQWGRATLLFPNAQGLGVTATPLRLDRQGLDSVFDTLIVGPDMRTLINQGHLSDYRIYAPPASIDRSAIALSRSGEFQQDDLRRQTRRSTITGDVVEHYLRLASGKRGLTFCVDVETAEQTAEAFRQAGVPALMLHGGSSDAERVEGIEALKRGDVKMITNVDLFGEGFDCPSIEVVHMARPTQSYGLYVQQFGRAMRPLEGKTHGIVIDHVGNVVTHGLPDSPRQWTLAGRDRQARDPDDIPVRACPSCLSVYRAFHTQCPNCGYRPVPVGRSTPQLVDGDLEELDPMTLSEMRANVIDLNVTEPAIPVGASGPVIGRKRREHSELLAAQRELRQSISYVAGYWHYDDGMDDREINKRFYISFGTTILEACGFRRAEAEKLNERLRAYLDEKAGGNCSDRSPLGGTGRRSSTLAQ